MHNIKLPSRGYYKLEVLREGTPVPGKSMHTNNVITYGGAYKCFFGTAMFGGLWAAVGQGSVERVRGDNALGNELERTSTSSGASRVEADNGDGTSTVTCTRVIAFSLGQVVGNISEVGLYDSGSSGTLIAGQLIKDEFGDPTTLTLLAGEQLKVTYTLEFIVPNAEQPVAPLVGTGTVTSPRGSHTFNMYAQPFFAVYNIPSSDKTIRGAAARRYTSTNSSGGTLLHDAWGGSSSISKSHDGSGTVTVDSPSISLSPTMFNSADIKYMSIGGASNKSYAKNYNIDTTSKRVRSDGNTYGIATIEFDPAVEKKSTEAFTFQFQIKYSI